jgi:iron complex outermembrane receptor protein
LQRLFYLLSRRARIARGCALAALMLGTHPAAAQRASEDVVASADDAFGTTVGNESIGLYTTTDARGFSPKDAGNFRIEGLYFDQVGFLNFSNVLVRSTNIRVGLSAQSYPFPAPTGIADIQLRLPGRKTLKSVNLQYGPFASTFGEVDVEVPRAAARPGFVVSVAAGPHTTDTPPLFNHVDASALMHWAPRSSVEVIAFAVHSHLWNGVQLPLVFTGGAYLPPQVERPLASFFHQSRQRIGTNAGVVVRSVLSEDWRLQIGTFLSTTHLKGDYSLLYFNTRPDGLGDLFVRARPPLRQTSYSGEVRASRLFHEGNRLHTLHFSARGRAGRRLFAGDQTIAYGAAFIDQPLPFGTPTLNYGPQSRDTIRHGGAGVSYVGLWPKVGELSIGVQKAFYRRTVAIPLKPSMTTSSSPWLYNGTLAVDVTRALTFYAGYTRGLEDTIIAPDNAINPGEAPPATLSKQVEAGLRYKLSPSVTFVAGVFEIKKPYFDRDALAYYTRVGTLSHRGAEFSLSGTPREGLKIVAGAVLLKARVAGETVDQGLIAKVPLGRFPAVVRFNATYGPMAWRGFSLTTQIKFEGAHYANRLNTVRISSATVIDLGARYNFKIQDVLASVRIDAQNVTNSFAWVVNPVSGHFTPSPARRYTLRVAADF